MTDVHEKAIEIAKEIQQAFTPKPFASDEIVGYAADVISAKLGKLYLIPKSLEVAVRDAMLQWGRSRLEHASGKSLADMVQSIVSVVAPLLTLVEKDCKTWEKIALDRLNEIKIKDKRIANLLEQNQYAENLCKKSDKRIAELEKQK